MTEPSRDEQAVTDSGGTMTRLTERPRAVVPDLSLLEPLRSTPYDGPERAAGDPPYWEPGQIITWHYGDWADVLRVVRDDPRGLVAWLPADSQRWWPCRWTAEGYATAPWQSAPTSSASCRWRPGVDRGS